MNDIKPVEKPAAFRTKSVRKNFTLEKDSFPIIGIGASAGGLAAFEAFFGGMPATTESGMAIVIVQHLSPDHQSILTELIKRFTAMKVHEVTDGIRVERDSVYIIPPNKDLSYLNGKLHLLNPVTQPGHRLPIDYFFHTLADDQHEKAICVILSGTGSDGTSGARAIKEEGGLVIAQKPETTEYDGMPKSIISNGLADYVLPPVEIPAILISYTSQTKSLKPISDSPLAKHIDVLNRIFILLRTRTGHDFSQYKPKTILRRLERRMAINQIDNLANYLTFLQNNVTEVDALFHDFLIGVTSFFRDPDAFDTLQEQVIPQLFAGKTAGSVVRVWIPGCSTGEEAYSIAMILREFADKIAMEHSVQIFATDIDSKAIERARTGIYSNSITADITPERLTRFFALSTDNKTYQIRKSIRELIVFSEHDVIKDPPFSKVDLILCRNLLIYLNPILQKKLIPLFHFSLNDKGVLFLGSSESTGEYTELFKPLNKKWKIYLRLGDNGNRQRVAVHLTNPVHHDFVPEKTLSEKVQKVITYPEIAEAELLRQYAPASVIINAAGDALYYHGRTGKFLEPAPGEAAEKLIKMAREGLQNSLANAIHRAVEKKETVYTPNLKVKTNGDFTTINLRVKPIILGHDRIPVVDGELYMVMFEVNPGDLPLAVKSLKPSKTGADNAELLRTIEVLELQNRSKEEYIQTTMEEMEASSEELKSTNEELQSLNEETQSTNEELETSREELQSVNEELATVNNELQSKIQHLSHTENDLNNLMSSTGIGTIFVDLEQVIKRYTPGVGKIIKLIKGDVGRPVSDISTNLINYHTLSEDIQSVLDTLIPLEKDVQAKGETWYLVRIIPYRTLENVIDGAVINFIDITLHKKAESVMHDYETLKRLTAVVHDANDAILMLDLTGNILAWNPAAKRMYGYSEKEILGKNLYDLIPETLRKETRDAFGNLLKSPLKPFTSERICHNGKVIKVSVTATALSNAEGAVYAIATTEQRSGL